MNAVEKELEQNEFQQRIELLTPREKQVMYLVTEELTNRQIAERLGISFRTVELHLGRVRQKMNVGTRIGLVKMLIRNGYAEA